MSKKNPSESNRLAMLDTFVIASVLTILLTRAYLAITGYPQIGGTNLHIAHMLYGGAILVAAFLFLLLAKKPNKHIAASIGGLGFGLFIDEIGKFVTKNNDYFYKPSFGLMYICFLAIWFFARLAIVKADDLPLLSPAEWPSRKILRIGIIFWTVIQIMIGIGLSTNMLFNNIGTASWNIVTPKIAAVATLVFCAYLIYGLLQLRLTDKLDLRKNTAARTIRTATIIGTLIVYPFYFLGTPLIAGFFIVPTMLVLIGLSEVSIEDLIRNLFAKPIL